MASENQLRVDVSDGGIADIHENEETQAFIHHKDNKKESAKPCKYTES